MISVIENASYALKKEVDIDENPAFRTLGKSWKICFYVSVNWTWNEEIHMVLSQRWIKLKIYLVFQSQYRLENY